MTTDKISGKSAQLRSMIIKAWRERWTASQYGTQVKCVLGRGVSGDVYGLADTILQQALTGPAPNQLLLSLLSHSIATQLVSHSATLHAISKFSSFSRPHCTAALLSLILSQRQYLTCRSHRPEECLLLATGLVAVSVWALSTTTQSIARLVELRDSHVDMSNLSKVLQLLKWLSTDRVASCLAYTGRLEDTELHQELLTTAKSAAKACDQIYMFSPENSSLEQDLRLAVEAIRSLDPTANLNNNSCNALSYTLHSLLSFDAVLCPTSDLTQLAGQLSTILSLKGISLACLVCEITQCCLLAMNEHDGFEVLKWDAFTLIKLPRLIGMLVGDNGRGEVHQGLARLLEHHTLLDMTDARCKAANSFELVVRSMKGLLTDVETEKLLSERQAQLEPRKVLDLKPPPDSRDVNLIIKADSTLATIIQTFENRTTEQSEFENLLSVMFHIIKGSSFDLLLSASAANGTLNALVSKLLLFNEGCKESQGESVRVSQNRAALFDMTFLMLVYMVQCFGSHVILKDTTDCFFSSWAKNCMVEPELVKPLCGWAMGEEGSLVDSLVQQFTQGEVRTQVVKWHNVCNSVHCVMKEMLVAAECGLMGQDMFARLCQQLYNKLCCFPVCVVSWLASYTHFGEGGLGTGQGGWRKDASKGVAPLDVVDKFLDIQMDIEDSESLPYFQQRSTMMVNIVRRMRQELEKDNRWKSSEKETNLLTGRSYKNVGNNSALEEDMNVLWEDTWRRGRLDIAGTKQIVRLFDIGGPQWFVTVLVEKMVSQVYNQDVERATELVFSLLHIDLVCCTLSLLVHTLPRVLAGPGKDGHLSHPGGRSLARLTVQCLAASLAMRNSAPYGRIREGRGAELAQLCNGIQQPVKLRKLNGGEAVVGDLGERATQEQLVDQAHTGLFHLLSGLGQEPVLTPRLEFVCTVLEESVLAGREQARQLLSPLPPTLIMQLVKVQPKRFSMELVLRLFDSNSSSGRKNMARILCLMRNIQAFKDGVDGEAE